jgi:PAS domain S-box-containing protein
MSDAHQQSRLPNARAESPPDGDNTWSCATFTFEWDPRTDLISRSPECSGILGLQPEAREETGRELLARIPAQDRLKLEETLAALSPSRPSYRTSYRYLAPGRRELILEEQGWAEFDASMRLVRRLGIVADVTAHRQAEQELRQSERHLRLALAAARGGIWCLDPVTRGCIVSAEVRELLHLPPDAPCTLQALLGQVHPSDRARLRACLETAMREVAPYQVEFRVLSNTGRVRWVASRAEPCTEIDRDPYLLGLVQDISERKAAEETLLEADRRKDEFLALLAHELRNPLTPIRNVAELLRRIDSDDPRLREAARMIERQSAHVERLIEDLLDVTRITRGSLELRREIRPLADILAQALELTQPRIKERGQRLDLGLCADSVLMDCDPVRLCQVFTNLLDNAVKYTDEGGKIRLQTRVEGTEALIRISDNGRGISPSELPYVFDGLARTRPRSAPPLAGLGLGLSIVKRLVSMHGGTVSAKSPGVGQGSSFSVRLPLNPTPELAEQKTADRSPLRILVVDDDLDIARSTALLLQSLGHEVELASSGEEALQHARKRHYQLVLLDIGLGSSDGLEVARRLRQLPHGRIMRIAAVTGHGDARTRRDARAAGIDRHLVKPVSLDALQDLITSLPS